jgi:Ca-activated chloride channel family protein
MMPMPAVTDSRLVTPDARTLPLRGAALRTDASGGLARAVLSQTFANPHAEPLHVTYTLPLPADAAVSGFRFVIGERVIEGEIDTKHKARERFHEAIASGQTAALLEEERSSLFTQEIGNVPPGAQVICEIVIDQKLRWLGEGQWEWRFPLAAAPRYLGAPGRVKDSGKIALDVAETLPVRASLAMTVRDEVSAGRSPESPSHPLSCVAEGDGFSVELGSGNAVPLDRDVVVRWPVAGLRVGARVDTCGPRPGLADAHALVTLVPPSPDAKMARVPRDLTVLLDTSGSMGGEPIEQAKRVTLALLDGLDHQDQFELIEFSMNANRFRKGLLPATRENVRIARDWVKKLQASGGTEMRTGILEALRPLRAGCPRQVILITDGLIGFEQEIVAEVLRGLPSSARLHTVGVGSSVNRSLTGPAARAGRGVEVVIGLGEDPERAAQRIRARCEAPFVVEVEVSGSALLEAAPMKVPDLYAGAPVLLSARVRKDGGELVIRGKTAHGAFEERLAIAATTEGSGEGAIAALFGREAVEDAEMRLAAGASSSEIDARVESLGLAYRIATRKTSWVAIDKTQSVDPRDPTRREHVPQALPYGTSIEGLGLREEAEMEMYAPAQTRAGVLRSAMPMRARHAPAPAMGAPQGAGGMPPGAPPPPPASYSIAGPQAPREESKELADEELDEGRLELQDEAPPRAAKKESLLGRIGRALFGDGEDQKAAPEPAADQSRVAKPDVAKGAREQAVRELRGRILVAKDGAMVIEIAVGGDLEWTPGEKVRVRLDDGRTVEATLDDARTTRSGTFSAGATVRLALRLPAGVDGSSAVEVDVQLASGPVKIVLGA